MGYYLCLLHTWKDLDPQRCYRDPVPGRKVIFAVEIDASCSSCLHVWGGSTLGEVLCAASPLKVQCIAGYELSP